MGCCLSTDGAEGGSESRRHVRRLNDDKGASFGSIEEETVKEVLSETPARPACFVSRDNARKGVGLSVKDQYLMMMKQQQQDVVSVNTDEVSDVGSLNENVAQGRDSSEYFYRNRANAVCTKSKSFSGEMGRQRSGRRSPVVKSSEPSPVRRRRNENGGAGRRDSPQKGWGRVETGERSGRRSRSPGMRGEMVRGGNGGDVGRSPSGRKMQGQSPNRARGSLTADGSGRRREEEGGGGGGGKWGHVDESLENPLVALECFIFL